MRMTRLHAPTLKETSKDVEVASHQFLLRGGYIRQIAAGIYDLLPLGWRVVRKIEAIIREEMDRSGAQELLMPVVQPSELWKESNRWKDYGSELLRFEDRKKGEFCLGPTHEEVIVDLVRRDVKSYRQLPLNLYQIQTKFRDELRPRAGLLRGREFMMKDSYSFDASIEKAHETYHTMFDTYVRIFTRCGLDFRPVEADTGSIGGNLSHEFQVLADSGEDAIVSCHQCGYTANVEKAVLARAVLPERAEAAQMKKVELPANTKPDAIAKALGIPTNRLIQSAVYDVDDDVVVVLWRADYAFNDIALKAALDATLVRPTSRSRVEELFGCAPEAVGPLHVDRNVRVIADPSIHNLNGAAVAASEAGAYYINVDVDRDINVHAWHDVRLAGQGDRCGRCGGQFAYFKGIEVGQVFYLGTKYTEPMQATFLNEDGVEQPLVMGCYGIGVTRVVAAAIEQNHDERGIIWPLALAPYAVHILPLQMNQADVVETAEGLYKQLLDMGVEALLDDRDVRAGGKFADADLYGIPLRVQIGSRGLKQGLVEVRTRANPEVMELPLAEVPHWINSKLEELG